MSSLWLNTYRGDVHSQNGEDGIIAAIFARIGANNRWCCDVGAHDGITWSNVASLVKGGWRGVLIESDPEKFPKLEKNMKSSNTFLIKRHVRGDLDEILFPVPIPRDFDLLNIDVDGLDLEIWRNLKTFAPRVVIIEVDSLCKPFSDTKPRPGMATIDQAVEVGKSKGYELALHTGNAIFVRAEVADTLGIDRDNWSELFDSRWIGMTL